MTEFGSLALVDEGAGDGEGVNISLPGVRKGMPSLKRAVMKYDNPQKGWHHCRPADDPKWWSIFYVVLCIRLCFYSYFLYGFFFKGDMSSRHFKPEIRVSSLRFSPTGRLSLSTECARNV